MRTRIKLLVIAFVAVFGIGLLSGELAYAAATCSTAADCANQGSQQAGGGSTTSLGDVINTVSTVLVSVLGAIAVIMIIIGGIRYVISQGDSSAVKAAKDTILYAVIGLIVALLSYAIVQFVVSRF